MFADGTEPGYTSPGISLALDARGYNIPTDLTGSEDVSNNRIVGNTITGTGNSNEVGIEIGVIGLGDDPTKIAATMGIIHDNYVEDNTIDNSDDGLYCYVVEDITVMGNEIKNCVTSGVYIREDFTGTINFNNIHGNNCGLNSTVSTRTIDATCNWWGDTSGPNDTAGTIEVPPCTADPTNEKNADGTGNKVSDNVDYCPWLATSAAAQSTGTATGSGTATFSSDVGQVGFAGAISEASLPTAGKPNINFPHGFFSFTITGVTPGGTAIVTITLPPGPTPTQYWKYHASEGGWIQIPMAVVGPNVITITLVDGGLGDDDGDATNGIIVDQGGSGNPGPGPRGPVGWETYPVSKVRVLLPWIALLAAIVAGVGLIVLRRRRAQG
jgi:hypothetical protein